MTDALNLTARALAMDFNTIADVLTWTDEPDLIRRNGEPVPVFDPVTIAAARLANSWEAARIMGPGQ